MKVCNNCGANITDNAPFCPNCGASVQPVQPAQPAYPVYQQPMMGNTPVTVGGWIGRLLIPYIPLVGWLVNIIMLFIWTGDATKEESFRNWAKAQLIITAVIIVLCIIGWASLASIISEFLYYM